MEPVMLKPPKFFYLGLDTDESDNWRDAEQHFEIDNMYGEETKVAQYQLVKAGTLVMKRVVKWDKPAKKKSNKKGQKNGKSRKNAA